MTHATRIVISLGLLSWLGLSLLFAASGAAAQGEGGTASVMPPPGCDLPQPALNNPIVYTGSPRNLRKPLDLNWQDASSLQNYSDTAFLTANFDESDVRIRWPDGSTTMVYNCTTSPVDCAAQEAAVSPDKSKIVFSVTFGKLWEHISNKTKHLGAPINAKLYLWDVAAEKLTEIPNQSSTVINRAPDFLDNETIVYGSNAAGTYPTRDQWPCHQGTYPPGHPKAGQPRGEYCAGTQTYPTSPAGKSMHIWRMKIDGTAQVNLTPGEQNAMWPVVLRHPRNKGRIAYSVWWNQEDQAHYRYDNGPATRANRWMLFTMAPDGTSPTALLGAHHSGYINKQAPQPNFQQVTSLLALRGVAEGPDGRLYAMSYYRGNHVGSLSDLLAFTAPLGDFQVEGCLSQACYKRSFSPLDFTPGPGHYVPADLEVVTSYSVGSDNSPNVDEKKRPMGAAGYPMLLANGRMGGTHGWGLCYQNEGGWPFSNPAEWTGITSSCNLGIVEFLTARVTDPYDPKQVRTLIDSPLEHEFDAQEIVARPVLTQQPPLDATKGCFLEVVDLRNAETAPAIPNYKWNRRAEFCGFQGCSVKPHDPTFHRDNVTALGLWGVQPHTTTMPDPKWMTAVNYTGWQNVWYMGKQDMMADGSVKMQVPCGKSFTMCALDAEGRCITHDGQPHNLRPGETKTCHGCHDGHSQERRLAIGRDPQQRWAAADGTGQPVLAAATNPPLINGRQIVTFAQVGPIVTKACGACHTGFQNDALLWSRLFADNEQLDFPWMKKVRSAEGNYILTRPNFSGLFSRFWRWSMFAWVAEGKRLDGYMNSSWADDPDYPTGHPAVPITPAERTLVMQYLQQGAPRP